MANFTRTSVEDFVAAAKKLTEANSTNQQSNSTRTFTTPFEFKYVACGPAKSEDNWRVLRFVGAPIKDPASYSKPLPSDAHIKFITKILDQNGKNFLMVLPDPDTVEGQNNIIWQIQKKVTHKTYNATEKKSHYDVLELFPEIDSIVNHGGLTSDSKRYNYVSSWFPKAKVFMNCIDRTDDWCKKNKHTKVFCKSDNIDDNGNEWVEPGVKVFGFYDRLLSLASKFNGWESFDALVVRTGTMNEPWNIKSASRIVEKELEEDVPSSTTFEEFSKKVVVGDLTDEELTYDRYDFDKIIPSTPKQIMFHLGKQIKKIDELLNTTYYDVLSKQCDEQEANAKTEFENSGAAEAAPVQTEAPVAKAEEPVVTRKVEEATTDFSFLGGWSALNQSEKDGIASVDRDDAGKVINIIYKDTAAKQYACPKCAVLSPATYTHCPNCGAQFEL